MIRNIDEIEHESSEKAESIRLIYNFLWWITLPVWAPFYLWGHHPFFYFALFFVGYNFAPEVSGFVAFHLLKAVSAVVASLA